MTIDTHWDKVVLLTHCDGADSSTTFTDTSDSGHTITTAVAAEVSTTQSKFGGASLLLPGDETTGSGLTVADHVDFGFGTGDWTVELFVYPTAYTVTDFQLLDFRNSSAEDGVFYIDVNTGKLYYYNGTIYGNSSSLAVTLNQWNHIAYSYDSGVLYAFLDGTLAWQETLSLSFGATNPLYIGQNFAASNGFEGHGDEIRITKGVGRYTETFVVPTQAYPDGHIGTARAEAVFTTYEINHTLSVEVRAVEATAQNITYEYSSVWATAAIEATPYDAEYVNLTLTTASTAVVILGKATNKHYNQVVSSRAVAVGAQDIVRRYNFVTSFAELVAAPKNITSLYTLTTDNRALEITQYAISANYNFAGVTASVVLTGPETNLQPSRFVVGVTALIFESPAVRLLPISNLYVINTVTSTVSTYHGLTLKSLATVGSNLLMVELGSLLKQAGTTDAGRAIVPLITTGELVLAGKQIYNVPKINFTAAGTGIMTVGRYTTEQGTAQTPSSYSQQLSTEFDQYEMMLETRQAARTYKFDLGLSAVGDMLESFNVYVNPVRHRRG